VPVVNQGSISGSAANSAHRRQESATQQPLTAHVEQEENYELEGTAPRPGGPGHLYNVWSEGRKDEEV
jgi:diacylglycerol diphosphate phosphatase/phosphatidate phosphatase